MIDKKKSSFLLLSFSLMLISGIALSNTFVSDSFAQTEIGVGVDVETESKVKVGNEESTEASAESKSKASGDIEIKSSSSDNESHDEESEKTHSESSVKSESKLNIKTAYPKQNANSNISFVMQSHNNLYSSGELVVVEGTLWSNLLTQLGNDNKVVIQIFDSDEKLVQENEVELDSTGSFNSKILLPENTVEGQYTITSKIQSDASVLSTLDIETKSKLETSMNVLVSNPTPIKIQVEDHGDFEISVASNSNVSDVVFVGDEKKLSFVVEGETGTNGVTKISIPKALLSGQLTVLIDGQIMASDKVIASSNTETSTTLELNYHHSIHTIEIVGTEAVPEFGTLALLVLVVAITGMIITASKTQIFRTV